jgi:hypothetical protein
MLATTRRRWLGDFGWAAVGGFAASLPATIQNLSDVYVTKTVTNLAVPRLVEVGVTIFFFAFLVASIFLEWGPSSQQILRDILNPNAEDTSWGHIGYLIRKKIFFRR